MLQPLQISTTAIEPHQDQSPQQSIRTLPAGSVVFARLAHAGIFERAELQSVHPATFIATVTASSSGVRHQIALDQITLSVMLPDEGEHTPLPSWDSSDSDTGADRDDAAGGDFDGDDDDGSMLHNPTALAVLDADLAAAKVCTSA